MTTLQQMKDKMTQLNSDVEVLKAVHAQGVVVPQADLDALAATIDALDASVKALAAPPAA